MDYYGFNQDMYEVKFVSDGSAELSAQVVEQLKRSGFAARLTMISEPRGQDGRGFLGSGLDHGVFIPFKFMFGDEFKSTPIIQVSIDGSLDPVRNYELGKAVKALR
jgi:aromatic ring-opening dioxygenase catalytic subunit (LigB family)